MCSVVNEEVDKYVWQDNALSDVRMVRTIKINQILYEQLDNAHSLTEKSIRHLLEYGVLEFKREMTIKAFELTDKRFELLRPKPMKSWEEGYVWFPKKKNRLSKFWTGLKNACSR